MNLRKAMPEGIDHARSSQCGEEFFDWIEINDAIGKTRKRLYKLLVEQRDVAVGQSFVPNSQ